MFSREQFDTALKNAGGMSAVATQIGETVQVLVNWRARGQVPANKCKALAAVTDLRVQDMHDDWRAYWPELDQPSLRKCTPKSAAIKQTTRRNRSST